MSSDCHPPYTVYKSDISYFSGKLEAYLKYKGIPYTAIDINRNNIEEVFHNTGNKKVPAVVSADGKWLYDTTPMIDWFEQRYPESPVIPTDPTLAFIALLVEDYGDEWLWRPAMWWRWIPTASRWSVGWRIGEENGIGMGSRFIGWLFGKRQLHEWLWGDGMTKDNANSVRDMLYLEFEFLEPLFEKQPFILGSHPSVADYGYFGSMFRHFGNDPDSAEVMRRNAPNTYEWTARLWNARIDKLPTEQQWQWPDQEIWGSLLKRIAKDYLPYLHQNAVAFKEGMQRFDYRGDTLQFEQTKTTHYRVWCREVLQQKYAALSTTDQQRVEELFAPHGGVQTLFEDGEIPSKLAENYVLPVPQRPVVEQSLKIKLWGQPRN